MNRAARALALLLLLAGAGCATLSPEEQARTAALVQSARDTALTCDQPDACAQPSAAASVA